MNGIGSGEDGRLTFLDILSIFSFLIGVLNLDYNVDQNDMDNQTKELDKRLRQQVQDIHDHLSVQDAKINLILNELEKIK